MDSTPSRSSRWLLFGAWLFLLVGLYVGAYFGLVYRRLNGVYNVKWPGENPIKGKFPLYIPYYTNFFGLHPFFRTAFAPLHRIDREIRHDYWEED